MSTIFTNNNGMLCLWTRRRKGGNFSLLTQLIKESGRNFAITSLYVKSISAYTESTNSAGKHLTYKGPYINTPIVRNSSRDIYLRSTTCPQSMLKSTLSSGK
jgi:hypothetical protein